MISLHETCQQYVARRLSEGWKIISQAGFSVVLQSPEGILRPVDLRNDVETLRPNAAGDETTIPNQSPASDEHWDKVDEAVADDYTTYVTGYQGGFIERWRDLYNLDNHSLGNGTINRIVVYARVLYTNGYNSCEIAIKSGATVDTQAIIISAEDTWETISREWATNPDTAAAWTWNEIDSLQAGLEFDVDGQFYRLNCTQVYVEVDYTEPPVTIGKTAHMADKLMAAGAI